MPALFSTGLTEAPHAPKGKLRLSQDLKGGLFSTWFLFFFFLCASFRGRRGILVRSNGNRTSRLGRLLFATAGPRPTKVTTKWGSRAKGLLLLDEVWVLGQIKQNSLLFPISVSDDGVLLDPLYCRTPPIPANCQVYSTSLGTSARHHF
ncbi:hypothetical protein L228DRAFT_118171 [Xylona heveae TC161]|uniref:Uncharacterized protein n=1 Tax=Xylona heveae (strain CBS 132557 / TC161) TaxID=1328760 RepID=A0A161TCK9_XYLHT|nr:hypothetical protein L228DRAFT_118171 [Xylona heveae TC161]KZF23527.1 hypothetical protein L228DRAFT_118171 [Xylona heveae TC161]